MLNTIIMKLSAIGIKATSQDILFIGQPELSGKINSEGIEYLVTKLKNPIMVRCSTMPEMPAIEVDELYFLETLQEHEGWEGNPEDGFKIPGYRADFSRRQEMAIYQETSIQTWIRGNRKEKSEEDKKSFLERVKSRQTK